MPNGSPTPSELTEPKIPSESPAEEDARRVVHKLNNLLTTVLVRCDASLLADPEGPHSAAFRTILESATEAEATLRRFRESLEPNVAAHPDGAGSHPGPSDR